MTQKEQILTLAVLINTRPMFGTFALGDGSGVYFCASCGRKSEPTPKGSLPSQISHKENCQERAHWVAIESLKLLLQDAGVDG